MFTVWIRNIVKIERNIIKICSTYVFDTLLLTSYAVFIALYLFTIDKFTVIL